MESTEYNSVMKHASSTLIALAAIAFLFAAAACSSSSDSDDESENGNSESTQQTDGDAGENSGSGADATGSVDGSFDSFTDAYVGDWSEASGQGTIACGEDSQPLGSGPEGSITATDASHLTFETNRGCEWTFRFDGGRVAEFQPPGQTCTVDESGTSVVLRPNRWKLEIAEQDKLRQEYQAIHERTTNGSTESCDVQWSGLIQR